MKSLLAILAFLLICSCGDDEPSQEKNCTASCEAQGGTFYLLTKDGYCYCSFTEAK